MDGEGWGSRVGLCCKVPHFMCSPSFSGFFFFFFLVWQRLDEAEESYVKALQLDPNYKDAEEELFKIRLEQLQVRLPAENGMQSG